MSVNFNRTVALRSLIRNRPSSNQHMIIYSWIIYKLGSFVRITKETNMFRGVKFIRIILKLFQNKQPSKPVPIKVNRNLRIYEYMNWKKETCCKVDSVDMPCMIPGNWQEGQTTYLMKTKYDESCLQLRPFCHLILIHYSI
jgi:hypothetical protein